MLYLFLAASIFVAAYGNAMTKRVYRRRALIASGRIDVPEMSRGYMRTASTTFVAGLVGMAAWLVLMVLGNPITLLANR